MFSEKANAIDFNHGSQFGEMSDPFERLAKPIFWGLLIIFLLVILAGAIQGTGAETLSKCHDGDTCTFVKDNGRTVKVRLSAIDAPELKQDGGELSKAYLTGLLNGGEAYLSCKGRSWSRRICDVWVNGQDVQAAMVSAGMAWDYPRYSKGRYSYLQWQAQTLRVGLWSALNVKSPYCHRHGNKAKCVESVSYQP